MNIAFLVCSVIPEILSALQNIQSLRLKWFVRRLRELNWFLHSTGKGHAFHRGL